MKRIHKFQTRVTLIFIFVLLFIIGLGNFLLYEYNLNAQFKHLKDDLILIARAATLAFDAETLLKIPLNKDGINSVEYKIIADRLKKIGEINPALKYIYIMTKTDKEGVWQFIADLNLATAQGTQRLPDAFPGDKYNALRFPGMMEGYIRPSVDQQLTVDEWGVTLSAYAPIYNNHQVVAVLGVDVGAERIYSMQQALRLRAILIALVGILVAFIFGFFISRMVTNPIEKLVTATRKIAAGNLNYKVTPDSKDEIGELASSFNQMAVNLAESRDRLYNYFYRIVQTMIRSLEAKDPYTRGHSDRVGEYAKKIALEMGYSVEKAELLERSAQLHDIGKLGINESVLNKNGPLSKEEWEAMRRHPEVGVEILRPVFLDDEMLLAIRWHHEHYDGSGYPDGLKGDQVNIFAQIIAVADAYDAMTSSRAYRLALSKKEAIERLKKDSGIQFNPRVVEAFLKIL